MSGLPNSTVAPSGPPPPLPAGTAKPAYGALRFHATVLLIGLAGEVLAWSAWRGRELSQDMIPFADEVFELLREGRLPDRGCLSSYASYIPPGTAWLMLPSMLLFDDPRLWELIGSVSLYFGAVVGVACTALLLGSRRYAYLAAALFALSPVGLFFAHALWPRASPLVLIWVLYLGAQWVARRRAVYLAAAVLLLALGTYQSLELAPAALILPALWLAYRPPVFCRWLAVAVVVGAVVWAPYVRFQWGRDFADLRSQVLRRSILPPDWQSVLCDPSLALWARQDATPPTPDPTRSTLWSNVARLTGVPGARFALLALALVGLLSPIVAALRRRSNSADAEGAQPAALAIGIAVVWSTMLALSEPNRPERLWWVWVGQSVALAHGTWTGARWLRRRRRWAVLAPLPVVAVWIMLATNPAVLASLATWQRCGYGGIDSEHRRCMAAVAQRSAGNADVTAGYQIFAYDFTPRFYKIDPRYKVGAEWDFVLGQVFGIRNANVCPEGVARGDRFRVVQTSYDDELNRWFFDVPPPPPERWRVIAETEHFQVFERRETTGDSSDAAPRNN